MTFEGQYLTYLEFEQLGGSEIGEMPFNLLEFEARRQIDIRTQNRLKDIEVIPQEVKICEYALINCISSYSRQSNNSSNIGNVASESTDGYSISYISADRISEVVKSRNSEVDDVIRTYLLGVIVDGEHIMYAGVR